MILRQLWLYFGCLIFCVHGANKTFVPTTEWKEIEEGQAIPAGLHVRVNLQTGKKEAKLLDTAATQTPEKSSLIKINNEPAKSELTTDKLKEILKNIKSDDVQKDSAPKKSFRSYNEIKEEFESLNMHVKTDFEILNELMDEFHSISNGSRTSEAGVLVAVLADLEYLVHQYDNAVEFARLSGFETIVVHCLNTSDDSALRAEALRLLGSAVQSNPRVQRSAVEAGCVTVLLKLLVKERDALVRSRGIYALSCLLRNFPAAQLSFVQNGGISVLSQLFDDRKDANEKTRYKVIQLLTDLLVEVKNVGELGNPKQKEHYELARLELSLREQGWCLRAANWLCGREDWMARSASLSDEDLDHDMVAATAELLLALSGSCLADFVINLELLSAVNHAKELYADLALHELDEGVTDSLYSDILTKLRALAVTFARTTQFTDEL